MELLVVIAVIGILMALLLPAVQAARGAARRMSCLNNLHQIGVGLHSYHNVHGSFPPGAIERRNAVEPLVAPHKARQLAWSAFLLRYLEYDAVYQMLDLDTKYSSAENAQGAAMIIPIYVCPSVARTSYLVQGQGACDYGGIMGEDIRTKGSLGNGVMLDDVAVSISEIRDGTSTTLIVSEDSVGKDRQWINGENVFVVTYPINYPDPIILRFDNEIRSEHPGGANALFCDGSVRFLQEQMDLDVLAAICTRAGGEITTEF